MSKKVKRWIWRILYFIGGILILYFTFGGNHGAYIQSKRKELDKKLKKREDKLKAEVTKLKKEEEAIEGNTTQMEKKLVEAKDGLERVKAGRKKLISEDAESMSLSEIADALSN